jgi:hypothetical protein
MISEVVIVPNSRSDPQRGTTTRSDALPDIPTVGVGPDPFSRKSTPSSPSRVYADSTCAASSRVSFRFISLIFATTCARSFRTVRAIEACGITAIGVERLPAQL